MHPIPVALKWDHVSDLKLADFDFRTPAHIDLLLETEVFTSILDGQRTGPRGTSFAINTCFGWVLFGKIEGSDVVDVANFTLEQLGCNESVDGNETFLCGCTYFR